MLLWTGDQEIARQTGFALSVYALGNATMGLCSFAYYIQFAKGDIKLHTTGSVLLVLLLLPATYFSTVNYGVVGAASTWAVAWILYLAVWVTYTHSILLSGQQWRWLFSNVLRIFLPCLLVGLMLQYWVVFPSGRMNQLFVFIFILLVLYCVALFASGLYKSETIGKLNR